MSDVRFNSGFSGCSDRMNILKNETVPRRLDDIDEMSESDVKSTSFIYVDNDGKDQKISINTLTAGDGARAQSDWEETDESKPEFIKNKPNIEDLALTEDLVSLYTVGGVRVGQKFEKGTSLMQIVQEILALNLNDTIYFGVFDELPTDYTQFKGENIQIFDVSVNSLMSEGFCPNNYAAYADGVVLDNQYYVLVIPNSVTVLNDAVGIKVSAIEQGGWSLDFKEMPFCISSEGIPTGKLYYWPERATGSYKLRYRFAEVRGE